MGMFAPDCQRQTGDDRIAKKAFKPVTTGQNGRKLRLGRWIELQTLHIRKRPADGLDPVKRQLRLNDFRDPIVQITALDNQLAGNFRAHFNNFRASIVTRQRLKDFFQENLGHAQNLKTGFIQKRGGRRGGGKDPRPMVREPFGAS
ncbi:hypothetical protein [Labrenzia sp. THAF82]|uniref:hypothetical protein n=1 Tax=Labrenzia sp. THAF82 TaxID=2587861 RepID=UPI0012682E77|nr:hypothetical protein [Labrenzia sp. THAF82]